MRRRDIGGLSLDENMTEVTNNNVMSTSNNVMLTQKLYLSDKVRIAKEVRVDQDGNEILENEKNLDFFVTQTYPDNKDMYFVSSGDFKHKLFASELIKL